MPIKKSGAITRERAKRGADGEEARKLPDLLPSDTGVLSEVLGVASEVVEFYNFTEIIPSILEYRETLEKVFGAEHQFVEKDALAVRGKVRGRDLFVRPELPISVLRSFLEHNLHRLPSPQRLYYSGSSLQRTDGKGLFREAREFGIEIMSTNADPIYDAQSIIVLYRILEELRMKGMVVEISSVGCASCRPNYRKKLTAYYKNLEICKACREDLDVNPLRLLSCRHPACEPFKNDMPNILDSICGNCTNHFRETLEFLDEISLPYTLNQTLVGRLDYYSRTVFEFLLQDTKEVLGGGGRHDTLFDALGAETMSAVGGALDVNAIIDVVKKYQFLVPRARKKVFLIHVGDLAKQKSLSLFEELRKNNIGVSEALGKDSLSAQLEVAAKMGVPLALIFGQKEAYEESVIIRDMETGAQETVPLQKIGEDIKRRLKG